MSLEYEYLSTNISDTTEADFLDDEGVFLIYTVFIAVASCYIPLIIVTNSLVFWATILCADFHTPINILLFSLCIADMCTGLFNLPLYIMHYAWGTHKFIVGSKYTCLSIFATGWMSAMGSLIHLMFIAIDRFVVVTYPAKYSSLITAKRTIALVISIWIYIIIIGLLPIMGYNNYDYNIPGVKRCNYFITLPKAYVFLVTLGTIYPCIIIPGILYIRIAIVFNKQLKDFKAHYNMLTREQINQFKARASNVKITIILMCMFIALWLPYLLVAPFKYFRVFSAKNTEIFVVVAQLILYANSFVNAPIYAYGRRDYKHAYWLMLTNPPWKWKTELAKVRGTTGSQFTGSHSYNDDKGFTVFENTEYDKRTSTSVIT